jgi:phenylpropionate dioxygenase-like ring-hydroxylating dioxygenase large terminal subunit
MQKRDARHRKKPGQSTGPPVVFSFEFLRKQEFCADCGAAQETSGAKTLVAMIDDPILLNDWHVVARSSEMEAREVRPARLLGQDLVLWRSQEGLRAWKDLCVHRGSRLSGGRVQQGCLICPYHGWNYDASGQCVRIPAHPSQSPPPRARATAYRISERYGLIWVCLGTPTREVPLFAEWDDSSFRKVCAGPYLFKAHGPRVIENFLDVGHFPFVHAGLLGDPNHTEVSEYEVETTVDGVVARDIGVWQPDPDGTGQPAEVKYAYRVLRPLTAYFLKSDASRRFSIFNCVTPVEERVSVAWLIMALNYASPTSDEQLRNFQDVVSAQDIPVVESQRPELLPLDLQAELHLRSDRTAIAYRQWLTKIGLKYGTA